MQINKLSRPKDGYLGHLIRHGFSRSHSNMSSSSWITLCFLCLLTGFAQKASCGEMCGPALKNLLTLGVADPGLEDQLPNVGSTVCDGGPCCMPSLTDQMEGRGRHLIHSAMMSMASTLLERVTTSRDEFRESIENAIQDSEENSFHFFVHSYPRLAGHIKEPLRQLYAAFRAALTEPDQAVLERALESFWSDLFPIVYHSAIHSRLQPFSHGYMECLREARSSHAIRPWKFVPEQSAEPLVQGFESAQLMIHSLNVGSEVIVKARLYEVPEECGAPAARLYFCSSCHASLVPPCSGLCLNVARGCLAPLAEIDGAWKDLGNAVARIEDSIRKSKLANILKEFPDMILYEAITYAMEAGAKLQKLVHTHCGAHVFEPSLEWDKKTQEGQQAKREGKSSPVPGNRLNHGDIIEARAAESASIVASDFWTQIADETCARMATQDVHCWNGKNVAKYSRPAAGVGVSAQKYNPEVQIARPDTSVYGLADQLREVKRLVTKKLSWLPESDSSKRADARDLQDELGSGDGKFDTLDSFNPGSDDDEDGDFGSGSGPKSLYDEDHIRKYGSNRETTQVGGAVSLPCTSICKISVLLLLPFVFRRLIRTD